MEIKIKDQQDKHCLRCGGFLKTMANKVAKEVAKDAAKVVMNTTLNELTLKLDQLQKSKPHLRKQIAQIRDKIITLRKNTNPDPKIVPGALLDLAIEVGKLS
jgi:hypothetical protein